ncbi:MAG TPA: nickel-dependent lactate racemase [bacterium]|nr:nickel-dependent lactate racemase [bacterium]HPR86675.1 nickel-dependent lactate racemase [bacterium]
MQLAYGSQLLSFHPDSGIHWRVFPEWEPDESAPPPSGWIEPAIAELIRQLTSLGASRGDNLLLVVPDHTRRCRLDEILPRLLPELEDALSLRIRILVANGSHVLQPEARMREVIGAEVYEAYPVVQHDCREEKRLEFLGTTTRGTPVTINRMALETDWVVTIGGILYHYFAGFGGGPKMLLPGIAGEETIRRNHRLTLDPGSGQFHPDCREGEIERNPVYLDLAEVCTFFPHALSLQLVLSPSGRLAAAAAGTILATQRRLLPEVRRFYSVPIPGHADLVIASAGGYPGDVNLIQSHKSIHHAFQALKPGGTLVVLAECSEGIGSAAFMSYFTGASAAEMGGELLRSYRINGHTALAMKSKTEAARVILVSALAPDQVRRTGMIPAASLEQAWELARPDLLEGATGYILPQASKYLPLALPAPEAGRSSM